MRPVSRRIGAGWPRGVGVRSHPRCRYRGQIRASVRFGNSSAANLERLVSCSTLRSLIWRERESRSEVRDWAATISLLSQARPPFRRQEIPRISSTSNACQRGVGYQNSLRLQMDPIGSCGGNGDGTTAAVVTTMTVTTRGIATGRAITTESQPSITAQGSLRCCDRGLQCSEPTDDQDDRQPEHLLANHVPAKHAQG